MYLYHLWQINKDTTLHPLFHCFFDASKRGYKIKLKGNIHHKYGRNSLSRSHEKNGRNKIDVRAGSQVIIRSSRRCRSIQL